MSRFLPLSEMNPGDARNDRFSCGDCGRRFGRRYNRDRHVLKCKATSRDDPIGCDVCGDVFVGDVELLLHDCVEVSLVDDRTPSTGVLMDGFSVDALAA